ncbi:MAG: homocysteine S-methyltransferase family protein [Pseudomonadota bacterium]
MTKAKYRAHLPQMGDTYMLTDGGLETTLIFHNGIDLPYFAAFDLLRSDQSRQTLKDYYTQYIQIAGRQDTGFILESATWRASSDWGDLMGYDAAALDRANRAAIEILFELRDAHEETHPFVISGNIGPRGDGYSPEALMTPAEAQDYHTAQIATFRGAGVDMLGAVTMTHSGEARGIARAAAAEGVPLALAFTLETDGRLPTGQTLGDAIVEVDADTAPAYYMINCAHPDHFREAIAGGQHWTSRIRGVRANASRMSHAELDEAEELDDGNPVELGILHAELKGLLPSLRVFGGCCGTDHRHVDQIAQCCVPVTKAA